jgi:hypothetical protein
LPAGELQADAWLRVWAGLLSLFAGPSWRAPAHPDRVLVRVYVREVVNLHVPAWALVLPQSVEGAFSPASVLSLGSQFNRVNFKKDRCRKYKQSNAIPILNGID